MFLRLKGKFLGPFRGAQLQRKGGELEEHYEYSKGKVKARQAAKNQQRIVKTLVGVSLMSVFAGCYYIWNDLAPGVQTGILLLAFIAAGVFVMMRSLDEEE